MPTQQYFFQLGRTPDLSLKELEAVVGTQVKVPVPSLAQLSFDSDQIATQVFSLLGGSLKIMRLEGEFSKVNNETLHEYAAAFLADFERPTFALAEFGRDGQERLDHSQLKKLLKQRGIGSRFIEGPREGLSASVLLHQDVLELNVIELADTVLFAKTLTVQDIDEWTVRDRQKPYADRKKGMLPPKVARMMVNMALGTGVDSGKILYDPFCGSGTVLMEALFRNASVLGSDLDKDAANGTLKNLEWLDQLYELGGKFKVVLGDATNLSLKELGQKVDYIVTEPFLGKPTPQAKQLPNIFKGLEKMYLGTFKNWTKLLNPGAKLVVVFPTVQTENATFSLEFMIDKLRSLGYTPLSEPVLYHRPGAIVQRQIWQFAFSK